MRTTEKLKVLGTDCSTVEEFARKYRKPERFTGRGEKYAEAVMETHRMEIEAHGYTCISRHDSVLGKFVVYIPGER